MKTKNAEWLDKVVDEEARTKDARWLDPIVNDEQFRGDLSGKTIPARRSWEKGMLNTFLGGKV